MRSARAGSCRPSRSTALGYRSRTISLTHSRHRTSQNGSLMTGLRRRTRTPSASSTSTRPSRLDSTRSQASTCEYDRDSVLHQNAGKCTALVRPRARPSTSQRLGETLVSLLPLAYFIVVSLSALQLPHSFTPQHQCSVSLPSFSARSGWSRRRRPASTLSNRHSRTRSVQVRPSPSLGRAIS